MFKAGLVGSTLCTVHSKVINLSGLWTMQNIQLKSLFLFKKVVDVLLNFTLRNNLRYETF